MTLDDLSPTERKLTLADIRRGLSHRLFLPEQYKVLRRVWEELHPEERQEFQSEARSLLNAGIMGKDGDDIYLQNILGWPHT